jgi:hypothetical protein
MENSRVQATAENETPQNDAAPPEARQDTQERQEESHPQEDAQEAVQDDDEHRREEGDDPQTEARPAADLPAGAVKPKKKRGPRKKAAVDTAIAFAADDPPAGAVKQRKKRAPRKKATPAVVAADAADVTDAAPVDTAAAPPETDPPPADGVEQEARPKKKRGGRKKGSLNRRPAKSRLLASGVPLGELAEGESPVTRPVRTRKPRAPTDAPKKRVLRKQVNSLRFSPAETQSIIASMQRLIDQRGFNKNSFIVQLLGGGEEERLRATPETRKFWKQVVAEHPTRAPEAVRECGRRAYAFSCGVLIRGSWTQREKDDLVAYREEGKSWAAIGRLLQRRATACSDKYRLVMSKQGAWSPAENDALCAAVERVTTISQTGTRSDVLWQRIAAASGTGRNATQCRSHWYDSLDPRRKNSREWQRGTDDLWLVGAILDKGVVDRCQIPWVDISDKWPHAKLRRRLDSIYGVYKVSATDGSTFREQLERLRNAMLADGAADDAPDIAGDNPEQNPPDPHNGGPALEEATSEPPAASVQPPLDDDEDDGDEPIEPSQACLKRSISVDARPLAIKEVSKAKKLRLQILSTAAFL